MKSSFNEFLGGRFAEDLTQQVKLKEKQLTELSAGFLILKEQNQCLTQTIEILKDYLFDLSDHIDHILETLDGEQEEESC